MEYPAHVSRHLLLPVRQNMAVDVEGDLHPLVAQRPLHLMGLPSVRKGQGCTAFSCRGSNCRSAMLLICRGSPRQSVSRCMSSQSLANTSPRSRYRCRFAILRRFWCARCFLSSRTISSDMLRVRGLPFLGGPNTGSRPGFSRVRATVTVLRVYAQAQTSKEFPHTCVTPREAVAKGFARFQKTPPARSIVAPKLRETQHCSGVDIPSRGPPDGIPVEPDSSAHRTPQAS